MNRKKIFLAVFFVLIFSLVALGERCLAEVAIIKIHFRKASDMLPLVKTMLSEDGRAAVDKQSNSVIISDRDEPLNRIRKFLADLDKPLAQVKIRFRFQEEGLSKKRGAAVSGRVSGKGWSVSSGKEKRDGVSLSVRDKRLTQTRDSESFISVLSGSAAYISVGRKIPYTERWIYLSKRYAHFVETVSFQHVETGMEVKPVLAGDHVHIEIIPRISYEEKGKAGVIRFTRASTKLFVPRGQWITIGGHSKESNEVIRHILSRSRAEGRTSVSLSLMVEF